MKKFSVLAIIICMATMASATVVPAGVQIGVNGIFDQDVIDVSGFDKITISVKIEDGATLMGWDLQLIADLGLFSDKGNAQIQFEKDWMADPAEVAANNNEYRWSGADIKPFGGTGQTGGLILDLLTLDMNGASEVLLDLYSFGTTVDDVDYDEMTLDRVTLVPEPVSIALLGLGGLFLRRRK